VVFGVSVGNSSLLFCCTDLFSILHYKQKSNVLCERNGRQKAHLALANGTTQKTEGFCFSAKNWVLGCGDFSIFEQWTLSMISSLIFFPMGFPSC